MKFDGPVRVIATHDRCADGTASALLLKDAFPEARAVFLRHGTPAYENFPAEPGTLFCDICPPRERAAEFLRAGAWVLDHHETTADIARAFEERGRGAYADAGQRPGVSGAWLAFSEVWLPEREPGADLADLSPFDAGGEVLRAIGHSGLAYHAARFAALAGFYDTWQKQDARWTDARAQAALLRFFPWESWFRSEDGMGAPDWPLYDQRAAALGHVLLDRDRERDEALLASAKRFSVPRGRRAGQVLGQVRVATFNSVSTSDVADRFENCDLVVGWRYESGTDGATRLHLSCRSRGDFDVRRFCESLGGGGHARAAGAVLRLDPELDDYGPYQHVRRLVERYLAEEA